MPTIIYYYTQTKKLKLLLAFIISASMLISCASNQTLSDTSGLPIEVIENIPLGAKSILINKDNVSADSLYEEIYFALLKRNHRIFKDDKQRHYLTTEGKDVGQSTLQRMTIFINEKENGSEGKITVEWKPGMEATTFASGMSGLQVNSDWGQAYYAIDRLGIAFAEGVAVAREVNNGVITYEIKQVKPPVKINPQIP